MAFEGRWIFREKINVMFLAREIERLIVMLNFLIKIKKQFFLEIRKETLLNRTLELHNFKAEE